MAGDSELTVRTLTRNAFVTKSTAVAYKRVVLSSSGNVYLDVSTMDGSKVAILLNASGGTARPTILIKDGGAFSAGAVGDISQLTSAGGEYAITVETSRFKDSNGYIKITKDTTDTTTVYVEAVLLP